MSAKTLLAHDPGLLTEAEFSGLVVEVARLGGWTLRYHTHSSKRSSHGYPDWFFWHPGSTRNADEGYLQPEVLMVELKTEAGRLSDKQQAWIDALTLYEEALGSFWADRRADGEFNVWHPFRVRVWRPSDYDEIVKTLTGREPAA